jgi:hypothetical protein
MGWRWRGLLRLCWSCMTKSNYTSPQQFILDTSVSLSVDLGGNVRSIVALDTGEWSGTPAGVPSQGAAVPPLPLSTAHIRPQVEWNAGASLLQVKNGQKSDPVGGGQRGEIKGFSRGSRRRLMQTIARVRRDAELPNFVTLTYPNQFPDPKESKRDLKVFCQRLERAFPSLGYIWKLEPQERGAPHYHMLTWGVPFEGVAPFVPFAWNEIAGRGDPYHLPFHLGLLPDSKLCVSKVNSFRGVWSYASKYLGKTFEVAGWNEKETGRFWGVGRRQNVPFGEPMTMFITLKDAHQWMRYQRRFAGLKGKANKSLTIFCNSEEWVKRIIQAHGEEVILDQDKPKAKPV